MIYYRLVLVVSTISFLAGSAVASLDRDAKSTTVGRKLKSSKSEKASKVDTESPTASPTTSPTEPQVALTAAPTKVPTTAPSKVPTTSPTDSPTSKPTESPTTAVAPKFKKVFFSTNTASFSASADAFDEAVADQIVQFLDEQPCGNQVCVSNGNDRDCSRDSFSLSLIANSNNKIQKFKGKSTFVLSDAVQTSKDCCANPTCVGKYSESESFDANSKVIFSITSNKDVITLKSGSWYELVVALYNADTDDLEASNVYRGNEDLSEFEGEFTGVPDGNHYLRIFPALYSYKGKDKVKSKFEVSKLAIATN